MTPAPAPGRARAALRLLGAWLVYRLDRGRREALIRELLAAHGEMSAGDLQDVSDGRLGGQVFADLRRLEGAGALRSRYVPRRGPRTEHLGTVWQARVYRLADAPRAASGAPRSIVLEVL